MIEPGLMMDEMNAEATKTLLSILLLNSPVAAVIRGP